MNMQVARRFAAIAPLALGAVTLNASALRAQEPADTFRLSPIVVTATRLPTRTSNAPAAISVITGTELRARGIKYVADALRDTPGAAIVQTGGFGGSTSLFMRGGESDYVKVLIDGVPANSPGGSYDFAHLTTENIDRIEIVRGPSSVLYGSDAVSGVIQVFTKSGRGRPHGTVSLRAASAQKLDTGRYGTQDFNAELSGGSAALGYSLGAARFTSDGQYPFNSDYGNTAVSGRVHAAQQRQSDISLSGRFTHGLVHFPTDGGGNAVDANQFRKVDALTLGLDAGHFFAPRIEARALLGANETKDVYDDAPDSPADTLGFYGYRSVADGARRSGDARINFYVASPTVLTAGAMFEQEMQKSNSASRSQYGPSFDTADVHRSNRGYYAQVLTETRAVTVQLGGRLDDNQKFGNFATYRAAAALRVAPGTRVRAAAGTAFKEPTFFENFAKGLTVGNPDLKPERTRSMEAGVTQELADSRMHLEAVYFTQRFQDLIQYSYKTATPGGPNYTNLGRARASGAELSASLDATSVVRLKAAYTYLTTRVTNEGVGGDPTFAQGSELVRRPRHTASVVIDVQPTARAFANASIHYVGTRPDIDYASSAYPYPRITLPSYYRVDLAGEYRFLRRGDQRQGITATLRIDNALNRLYTEVSNFPARSRTIFIGARVGFGL
jgi:vitamin B12 transporter